MKNIDIFSSEEVLHSVPEERWRSLLDEHNNVLSMYQSPEWIASLKEYRKEESVSVISINNNSGKIEGIVPVVNRQKKIKFDVKAKTFFSISVNLLDIAGSVPLLPKNIYHYNLLFSSIVQGFSELDGVYIDSVPIDSFFWQYLSSSKLISKYFFIHIPEGTRPHFSISLGGPYADYIGSFKKKRRAEFRRRIKIFSESSDDSVLLERVDHPDQVRRFLDLASAISDNSWQKTRLGNRIDMSAENCRRLQFLAQEKKLRAYLLFHQGNPCAFRLGYQYGDKFVSAETGYDQNYSHYSPGKVLTLLMIEDMSISNSPRIVDFGIGYAEWKRDLCNRQLEDASVYLMRKTLANKILIKSQTNFYSIIEFVKKLSR